MKLAARLADESAEVRERVRWIRETERSIPASVHAAIRERDPALAVRVERRRGWW